MEQFVRNPESKTITLGNSVQFFCIQDRSLPLAEIVWLKNGTLLTISSSNRYMVHSEELLHDMGRVSSSLLISAVRSSDAGLYGCRAINPLLPSSPVYSSNATLTVEGNYSKISWVRVKCSYIYGCNFVVIHHQNVRMSLHNWLDINVSYNMVLIQTLVPPAPPTFLTIPSSIVLPASGGQAVFICSVTGSPIPSITWLHNNNAINSSNSITIVTQEQILNTILTIANVQQSNSGSYQCRAENNDGSITSDPALLQIASMYMCVQIKSSYILMNILSSKRSSYTLSVILEDSFCLVVKFCCVSTNRS